MNLPFSSVEIEFLKCIGTGALKTNINGAGIKIFNSTNLNISFSTFFLNYGANSSGGLVIQNTIGTSVILETLSSKISIF